MKKIIFAIAILTIGLVTAQAGIFSTVSGMTMEQKKPLSEYTIDTAGINPRVYEFIPKNDRTKLCVIVFGNSEKAPVPAMQCFKKEK